MSAMLHYGIFAKHWKNIAHSGALWCNTAVWILRFEAFLKAYLQAHRDLTQNAFGSTWPIQHKHLKGTEHLEVQKSCLICQMTYSAHGEAIQCWTYTGTQRCKSGSWSICSLNIQRSQLRPPPWNINRLKLPSCDCHPCCPIPGAPYSFPIAFAFG